MGGGGALNLKNQTVILRMTLKMNEAIVPQSV